MAIGGFIMLGIGAGTLAQFVLVGLAPPVVPFAPADDDYTFTEASVAATNESAGTEYV